MIHSFHLHDKFYTSIEYFTKTSKRKKCTNHKKQLVDNYQGLFDGRFVFDGFILSVLR